MSHSGTMNQASYIENGDFTLEKSDVTTTQWARLMQDQVMLASLIAVTVKDKDAERQIPLFSFPLDGFEIDAIDNAVIIKINGCRYPILTAKCRDIPPLVFSDDGIYMRVPKKEVEEAVRVNPLKNYFRQSASLYTAHDTQFTAEALVGAYQKPDYKKSIDHVTVNHPTHRTISLIGVGDDAYRFEYANKKVVLHIWDEKFEVDAITHINGITILVDEKMPEAYSSKAFQRASSKPARMKEDEILLQGIIDGNVECFAAYIERNRRKYMKSLMGRGVPEERADDILQDVQVTYLELVADGKWKFEGVPENAAAWVETVIKNRRLDVLRKMSTELTRFKTNVVGSEDDENETDLFDLLPAPHSDPAQLIEKYDFISYMHELQARALEMPQSPLRHILGHACASLLDDNHRQHHYAASQHTSPDTMKTLMFRGRQALIATNMSTDAFRNGTFSSGASSFACLRNFGLQPM